MDLFTITGTAAQGLLAVDALCARHSYDSNKQEDESRADFAKRMLIEYTINEIKAYRMDTFLLGKQAALDNAEAETDGMGVA